jgi:hypothetical protein
MVHSVQSYLVIILRVAENFASCYTLVVSEAALGKTEGQLTSLTITNKAEYSARCVADLGPVTM